MDRLHAFLVNGKFLLPASCITSWILCLHNTEFSIFTVCIQNSLQQIRTRFFHPVHLFEFTPGVVFPAVHGKFCTRNSFFCLCIHFFHYKISYFRQMTGNVRCVTKFRSIPRHNSYSGMLHASCCTYWKYRLQNYPAIFSVLSLRRQDQLPRR